MLFRNFSDTLLYSSFGNIIVDGKQVISALTKLDRDALVNYAMP